MDEIIQEILNTELQKKMPLLLEQAHKKLTRTREMIKNFLLDRRKNIQSIESEDMRLIMTVEVKKILIFPFV
jgi:hypothetical protein